MGRTKGFFSQNLRVSNSRREALRRQHLANWPGGQRLAATDELALEPLRGRRRTACSAAAARDTPWARRARPALSGARPWSAGRLRLQSLATAVIGVTWHRTKESTEGTVSVSLLLPLRSAAVCPWPWTMITITHQFGLQMRQFEKASSSASARYISYAPTGLKDHQFGP